MCQDNTSASGDPVSREGALHSGVGAEVTQRAKEVASRLALMAPSWRRRPPKPHHAELIAMDYELAVMAIRALLSENTRLREALERSDQTTATIAILSHAGLCETLPRKMYGFLREISEECEAAGFDCCGQRAATG